MIDLKRTLYFEGKITSESVKKVTEDLFSLLKQDKRAPIFLMINSSGGKGPAAFAFYDTVKLLHADITTIGIGRIASMGLILFLSGKERLVTPNTTFFTHEFTRSSEKGYTFKLSEIKTIIKEMELSSDSYVHIVAEKSNGTLTVKDVHTMMHDERVINSHESINIGLATGFAMNE
jgi:ATP-dependent Clp protease protease subunit